MNKLRFIMPLLTAAVLGALIGGAWAVAVRATDDSQDPFDGYCYTVIDSRGKAHPSETDPPTNPGLWAIYQTPEESGIVTAPYVVRIDMPCVEEADALH